MDPSSIEASSLDLSALPSSPPVLLLKLNQGHTLEQLKRCSTSHNGHPTIVFQKDSITISIPTSDGTTQENHFRIAHETIPNLLVKDQQGRFSGVGYITNKLHPKDWAKSGTTATVPMDETRILSMSQEQQISKKSRATKKAAAVEVGGKPVPIKGVAKTSSSGISGPSYVGSAQVVKRPVSQKRGFIDDSESSDSEDSEEDEEEMPLASLAAKRAGKRPNSEGSHIDVPIPSKKPRTTPTPLPNPPVSTMQVDDSEEEGDEEMNDEYEDLNGSEHVTATTTGTFETSPAGKRPRSTASPDISAVSSSSFTPARNTFSSNSTSTGPSTAIHGPHLHSIESVTIPPELFPDVSREILTFDDFERSYKRFKLVWPKYIQLHVELAKNKADFETLQRTHESLVAQGASTVSIEQQLQQLYNERKPIIDPMKTSYMKLHSAMQTLRHQLETFSVQRSNGKIS